MARRIVGLISAFDVHLDLPTDDPYLRYELPADSVPTVLEAKQRVVIPYRLTALRDLTAEESGGGCFSYANTIVASGGSVCANGALVTRRASIGYSYQTTSDCPSGGSGSPTTGGGQRKSGQVL